RDCLLEIFDFVAEESEIALEEVADSWETGATGTGGRDALIAPRTNASPVALLAGATEVVLSLRLEKTPPVAQAVVGKAETQTIRVATDKVDKLINLVGELVINQSMLNEVIQDFSMAKLFCLTEVVAEMERTSRKL